MIVKKRSFITKPLLLFIVEISMFILNKDSESVDFFVMY